MLKDILVKAVVFEIVCLCVCTSITQAVKDTTSQTGEHQQTSRTSDENSVICGYVHDIETADPIEDARVSLDWRDAEGNDGWESLYTNTTGFYMFNTGAVEFRLYFNYEDYFQEHSMWLSVGENEVFWYNQSLTPYPPETVCIYGFITNDLSGEPVTEAEVYLNWYDNEGHSWYNYTDCNSSGYYMLGAIPGRTTIQVYSDIYYDYYSSDFYTQNNSSIWFNISLIPYPPVSAVIYGYITDAGNGAPIDNANVNLYCYTEYGSFYNFTYTNGIGFYSLGTIPGDVHISVYKSPYESTQSPTFYINENQTCWINLSMEYEPTLTSLVKGYVVDNETHAVVRNAFVRYDWKDDVGHFYCDYAFTDQKGFYAIMVPKGTVQFLLTANGYLSQQTPWFDINENTEQWLNTTVYPEISVLFTKPQPGIYINNESRFPILSKILVRLFPQFTPVIIGPLEITVNITRSTMGCDRVEFSIDGLLRGTDSEEPFTYHWNETGFSTHEIQVIAYDNAGPCTIETIIVRKIS
jgi:hypothetical protein